jgi:hypothetical protein
MYCFKEFKIVLAKALSYLKRTTLTEVEYGLVLFQDYPPYSDYLVKSLPFITNSEEFMKRLELITFSGGSTLETAVAEGLAACICDMDWKEDAEKYCFLIFSKPHSTPCTLIGDCDGMLAQDIASNMFASRGVQLSIMSPYDIEVNRNLFNSAKIAGSHERLLDCKALFHADFLIMLRGFQNMEWNYPQTQKAIASSSTVETQIAKPQTQQPAKVAARQPVAATTSADISSSITHAFSGIVTANTVTNVPNSSMTAVALVRQVQQQPQQPQQQQQQQQQQVQAQIQQQRPGSSTKGTPQVNLKPEQQIQQIPIFTATLRMGQKKLCVLEATQIIPSKQKDVSHNTEILNISQWPSEIVIQKQLPTVDKENMSRIHKKYSSSLTLWQAAKGEKKEDLRNLHKLIQQMIRQNKWCYVPLKGNKNDDNDKYLTIVPLNIYSSIVKNVPISTEKIEDKFVGIILDGAALGLQTTSQAPADSITQQQAAMIAPGITNPALPSFPINQQIFAQMNAPTNPYMTSSFSNQMFSPMLFMPTTCQYAPNTAVFVPPLMHTSQPMLLNPNSNGNSSASHSNNNNNNGTPAGKK